ncbi:CdiA family toxin C-terminal domain-containing protein [Listeria immobilis]|uniref:CdiA family toxin C-terminal domain-containing protein n=1 Tax=Listeria immobilis TaxID=2713502 RepID=UPI001C893D32|nr:CdiA family toxin C-terminal domain-containing protein [Listeria immobilis]
MANSEGVVRKGEQGVKGGHNIDSFYGELNAQGFNIGDCIINKKAHPTIKGIYEIEYKIPVMDNKGNIISNQYKNIGQPKTVYDLKYFSDSTIYNLGVEAMQNGKISGREISGIASNGLEFRGFINEAGEVTNFFPVYPK